MIKDDGTVIHFNNPKVQASLSANTFAITGHAETKQLTEMLPGILSQLGADSLTNLRKLAEQFPRQCKRTQKDARATFFHIWEPLVDGFNDRLGGKEGSGTGKSFWGLEHENNIKVPGIKAAGYGSF